MAISEIKHWRQKYHDNKDNIDDNYKNDKNDNQNDNKNPNEKYHYHYHNNNDHAKLIEFTSGSEMTPTTTTL